MSAMAVKLEGRGLQEEEAVALRNMLDVSATCLSRPHHQEERGLLAVLPPMVFCRVAVTLWPSAGCVHVALEWPTVTRKPCVQQYPLGSNLVGWWGAADVAVA